MANTTEAIRAIAGKLGLEMSYKKTEIMSIGQASASNPIVPLGNEGRIKVVSYFKYLGAFCSADGTNFKELSSRIGRASASFRELDKVWRDRNINLDTKMKFYAACVLSTLLYACKCWILTERDKARLDAFDMRCQRKILRDVWSEHNTNSSIISRTKQPQLTVVIRKHRLQWFGRLQRMDMDRIPKKLYVWKPSPWKTKSWPTEDFLASSPPERHQQNGLLVCRRGGGAARERIMWRYRSNQAVSAVMHDANQ